MPLLPDDKDSPLLKFRFFLQAIVNGHPGSAVDAHYIGSVDLPDNWKTDMLKIKHVFRVEEFPRDSGHVDIVIWKFSNNK
jgi:hypothetical protein